MATTTTWGYTNTTVSQSETTPMVEIGLKTNYAVIEDKADTVVYDNVTAPINLGEKVSFYYRDLKEVQSDNSVPLPGPVVEGFQFIVKLDAVSETTWDNGTKVDQPQVMMLTVRGSKNGNCTPDMIREQFTRLAGAIYDFTADEYRFAKLMRSGLQVTED